MFEKEYDIAMYGSGPATIFLANKLQQLNIKIIIIEMGEIDNVNKLETIDRTNGPIQFHYQIMHYIHLFLIVSFQFVVVNFQLQL